MRWGWLASWERTVWENSAQGRIASNGRGVVQGVPADPQNTEQVRGISWPEVREPGEAQ